MRGIIAELRSLQNQLCLSILSEACSSYFPENEFIILTTIVDIRNITGNVAILNRFSRSPVHYYRVFGFLLRSPFGNGRAFCKRMIVACDGVYSIIPC